MNSVLLRDVRFMSTAYINWHK